MARVAAFILARAGSKGLPGKNVIDFMGRPLIAHTIQHGLDCPDVHDVIVSTDGEEIAAVSHAAGAGVMMRPDLLATDTAQPKDAMRHHLADMARNGRVPEIVVLLQPTSPLRVSGDISACIAAIREEGFDSAATFQRAPSSPYRAWLNDEAGPRPFVEGFDPWQPRQNLPVTYTLNGAVYAARRELFLEDASQSFLPGRAKLVEMPSERSVDIDTALDLILAEAVAKTLP